jgi:hypothetical protein
MHWYDSNLWTYHKEITNYDWKIAKMTVAENWDYGHLSKQLWSVNHVHFSVVICDFLVESS